MITGTLCSLFAFVPFFAYITFLGSLHVSERTAVLNGRTDRVLLALGLSGFVVLGIGPAVIPLGSLDLYGIFALVLFFLLYIAAVFYLDTAFSQRFVVYNLSESDFDSIPAIPILNWPARKNKLSAENDETPDHAEAPVDVARSRLETKLRRAGGALVLPERGLTLSIEYSRRIRCAVLRISGQKASPDDWKALQKEVRAYFAGRPQPSVSICTYLLMLAVCAILGIAAVQFIRFL